MTSSLSPVTVGVSPSGVDWIAYPRSGEDVTAFAARVQTMTARLTHLALRAARARYAAARREVSRLKGVAARVERNGSRRYRSAWDVPGYGEASEQCAVARKDLRRLERTARRASAATGGML